MASIIKLLTPTQQKVLSGNAMHLVTQSSWMLYVLANVVPCDVPLPQSVHTIEEEDLSQATTLSLGT